MDAPTDPPSQHPAPHGERAGQYLVLTACAIFVGARAVDLWLANEYGRSMPWLQLVVAVYFAARLVTHGAPARWIAAAISLIWVWFDWTQNPRPVPEAFRLGLVTANLTVTALLLAGPGVKDWFRPRA